MKAGAAALAFFLYPLALAEWRCAFVFPCTVQELCRTCSTSLGPSRVSSHWPCWTAGLCAVKMRAAEASQNSKTQLQFRDKDVMWDSVKGFAELQVGDTRSSSFIHHCCYSVMEGHQICQAWFTRLQMHYLHFLMQSGLASRNTGITE